MKVRELRKILNELDEKYDNSEIDIQGKGYDIKSFEIYSGLFPTIYLESPYAAGIITETEIYDKESYFPYHTFLD